MKVRLFDLVLNTDLINYITHNSHNSHSIYYSTTIYGKFVFGGLVVIVVDFIYLGLF